VAKSRGFADALNQFTDAARSARLADERVETVAGANPEVRRSLAIAIVGHDEHIGIVAEFAANDEPRTMAEGAVGAVQLPGNLLRATAVVGRVDLQDVHRKNPRSWRANSSPLQSRTRKRGRKNKSDFKPTGAAIVQQ